MGVIKGRGQLPDDRKLTYHGSAPRRDVLKHGGQAGRWKVAIRQEGHTRGLNSDRPGPAGAARRASQSSAPRSPGRPGTPPPKGTENANHPHPGPDDRGDAQARQPAAAHVDMQLRRIQPVHDRDVQDMRAVLTAPRVRGQLPLGRAPD